jgi:uncharacterized membrane protein
MTVYNLVLFFHILSMLGLTIAVAFHWTMLHSATSALDGEDALRWIRATARLPLLVFPSLLTVLVTGIYMAARTNAFGRGWISASFLSILLIAAVSIVGGPATRALQRYARQGESEQIRRTLLGPLLVMPVRLQLSLLLTITFLMVVRTNLIPSLEIVSLGIAFGLFWSVSTWRTGRF